MQAAKWIAELLYQQEDSSKVDPYVLFLSKSANAGNPFGETNSILAEQYQQYESKRLDRVYHTQTRKAQFRFISILCIFLLLGVLGISSYRISFKRKRDFLEISHANLLEQEKKRNLRLSQENKNLLAQRERLLATDKPSKRDYEKLVKEPICLDLKQRFFGKELLTTNNVTVYSDLSLTKKQERLIIEAVERHCPTTLSWLFFLFSQTIPET